MKILIAAIELEIMKNNIHTFGELMIHSLFTFKGITPVLKFENVETRSQFLNSLKKNNPVLTTYIVPTPPVVSDMDTLALDPKAMYVAGYTKHTDVLAFKPPFKEGGTIDLALVLDILYVSFQDNEVYSLTDLVVSIQAKWEYFKGLGQDLQDSGRIGLVNDPERMVDLLLESAHLFRKYEASHRSRGPEHLAKAEVNGEIAGRIEAVLNSNKERYNND